MRRISISKVLEKNNITGASLNKNLNLLSPIPEVDEEYFSSLKSNSNLKSVLGSFKVKKPENGVKRAVNKKPQSPKILDTTINMDKNNF